MSVTFTTDLPRPEGTEASPCLCAQMGEAFHRMMGGEDSPEVRADLASAADPRCPQCSGTGVENLPVRNPHSYNLNEGNAFSLLSALGLSQGHGECSIADARRALVRARNINLAHLVREDETVYGSPCADENGVVELRPLRAHSKGLSLEGLNERISAFAAFVQRAAEAGATRINWG